MGGAGKAPVSFIGESHLFQPDPAHHAANEPVAFGHRVQMVERAAAHQPEIAGIRRDLDVDHAAQQAVEHRGGGELEPAFAVAAQPLAVNDIEAFIHLRHHRAEQFRRILQVGIENENALAATEFEPRAQGDLVAVVAGKVDGDDMVVLFGQLENGLARAVRRAIDDKDDLVGGALFQACGRYPPMKLGHPSQLVVARDDHRQHDGASRGVFLRLHQKPCSRYWNGNSGNWLENR